MLAVQNILGSSPRDWLVIEGYNQRSRSYSLQKASGEDGAMVGYPYSEMSEAKLRVRNIISNVSALQMLEDAAKRACDILSEMENLAERASDDYCSAGDAAILDEQFKKRLGTISELIRQIQVMLAKRSGEDGLLRGGYPIVNGPTDGGCSNFIEVSQKLESEAFDLTTDAKGALAKFREFIKELIEYRLSLTRQSEPLDDFLEKVQEEMLAILGTLPTDAETALEHFVVQIMAAFMSDGNRLARMQANLDPNIACLLLLR